jgi:hypothetical protein
LSLVHTRVLSASCRALDDSGTSIHLLHNLVTTVKVGRGLGGVHGVVEAVEEARPGQLKIHGSTNGLLQCRGHRVGPMSVSASHTEYYCGTVRLEISGPYQSWHRA